VMTSNNGKYPVIYRRSGGNPLSLMYMAALQ